VVRWYDMMVLQSQYVDVVSFNRYNGWYVNGGNLDVVPLSVVAEATAWHEKFNKPVIMQEYGGDTLEGLHFVRRRININRFFICACFSRLLILFGRRNTR
jgi:hypothetical protein